MQRESKTKISPFVKLSNLKANVQGEEVKNGTWLACLHGNNVWNASGEGEFGTSLELPVNPNMLKEDAILRLEFQIVVGDRFITVASAWHNVKKKVLNLTVPQSCPVSDDEPPIQFQGRLELINFGEKDIKTLQSAPSVTKKASDLKNLMKEVHEAQHSLLLKELTSKLDHDQAKQSWP